MKQGDYIRKYRKEKGMTQSDLAAACNVATGTIQQYELGKRKARTSILFKIAEALGVSLYDLLSDEERLKPEQIDQLKSGLFHAQNYYLSLIDALEHILSGVYDNVSVTGTYPTSHVLHITNNDQSFDLNIQEEQAILAKLTDVLPLIVDSARLSAMTEIQK